MKIGIPREIKPQEGRVALLPAQVGELCAAGHAVIVEHGAGLRAGAEDLAYEAVGAVLGLGPEAIYADAELIVKVKEILPPEFALLRPEHVIFSNLHAALDQVQLDRLLEVGLTAIAAEETHALGSPNSVLAGEIGALEGLRLTFASHGGTGRHFLPHFGAPATRAVVLGLGAVGRAAVRTLLRLGVQVAAFETDPAARRGAALEWAGAPFSIGAVEDLRKLLADADMIVNCVKWPKTRHDHLIDRADLDLMKRTAVIVDIACDRAGAIETSRPTTWQDPIYVAAGIRHFCVDNIPGAVPVAASAGYAEAILAHVRRIADLGALEACRRDPWLRRGLTCAGGVLILEEAARVQHRPHTPAEDFLAERSA